MLIPPFVDRSLGIPPANIPPRPGAPLPILGGGIGGKELGASALPALFALARAFGAGGLNPAPPGTGGAPLTAGAEPLLTLPARKHSSLRHVYLRRAHSYHWSAFS